MVTESFLPADSYDPKLWSPSGGTATTSKEGMNQNIFSCARLEHYIITIVALLEPSCACMRSLKCIETI